MRLTPLSPCNEDVHTADNDDDSLGHAIVRSIDTGAYIRCNDYLAAHGFNPSGYANVPPCPAGEIEDESTRMSNLAGPGQDNGTKS
jgi:hypothetical protein